jgi:demethylmenaquinone methyltransferase / 2-methoxy-6-polyprenyl-1,4-benzoquinol methylase
MSEVKPYADSREKKEQVEQMFDAIAPRYDRLNQILSLGIHKSWRSRAVREVMKKNPSHVLDLATGTGDFAIQLARAGVKRITASDISEGMMGFGREKIKKLKLGDVISFSRGDAENLPFDSNYFDAISIAFGVRNFQHLEKGLQEMLRVLKPGGVAVILEFSKPKGWFKPFYGFYFRFILPQIGKLVSKDGFAYNYLPESVKAFPEGNEFQQILVTCGYSNTTCIPLTFGVASIYIAVKSFT